MNEETVLRTYKVSDDLLPKLDRTLEKFAARAHKLGLRPPTYTVTGEEWEDEVREGGKGKTGRKFHWNVIELVGETPKLHGWMFIATIQHDRAVVPDTIYGLPDDFAPKWSNIVRVKPNPYIEELPPSWRVVRPWCEHCKTDRYRKDTYLVMQVEEGSAFKGNLLQIGRNCLQDFVRSDTAVDDYLKYIDGLEELHERLAGAGNEPREPEHYDLEEYLTHVACMIRTKGWVSRKMVEEGKTEGPTTGVRAFENMENERRHVMARGGQAWEGTTGGDAVEAQKTVEWVEDTFGSKPREELSDYQHNLLTIFRRCAVKQRETGFAASAIQTRKRFLERELIGKKGEGRKESEWQGVVGGHVTFEAEVVFEMQIEPMYRNQDPPVLYVFQDDDGNRFSWLSTRGGLEQGKRYNVVGLVKKHDIRVSQGKDGRTWQNKVTVVTRCKAEEALV